MAQQDLKESRIKKLNDLIGKKINPYPLKYDVTHKAAEIRDNFEKLEKAKVKIAGRLMLMRMHGKSGFGHVKDDSGKIQIYVALNFIGEEKLAFFKSLDIGDILGLEGEVFKTHTGEITVNVFDFTILSKSLLPLPEKWHGLSDVEVRYRQRYLDLIINEDVRESFKTRSRAIQLARSFLKEKGFLEVETPMMQPIYGGAYARPFITHHNALDMDLYLRIAPELYLKRLIVGGFEKVYELNRNFRNEGISTRHNPEFTMLELYQAYADYNDMMNICEDLVCYLVREIKGSLEIEYQGQKLSLNKPWKRIKYFDALQQFTGVDFSKIKDPEEARSEAKKMGFEPDPKASLWEIANILFEEKVETNLIQPTFIMDYPKELSPLAKQKPDDPELVERFEPYIGGREIGNAFSELNDPLEQRKRFEEQVEKRKQGNWEAHPMDMDFLTALEYGMPPTGGLGIGMDRIIMLLVDTNSIRDTILFPLLKPKAEEKGDGA
ncbi:MAG: lysine--tRNA ligase [bacterium]|nr:lysine--tRNA ligase [bacterium]